MPMKLADWVKEQPGTRADVAARLGVRRSALQKMMRGESFPRQGTLFAILDVTEGKVTAADLERACIEYQASLG